MSALTNYVAEILREENNMSTTFAIRTILEIIIAFTVIYLYFNYQQEFIAFEQNVKRIVIGNIRRAIRIRNERKGKTI